MGISATPHNTDALVFGSAEFSFSEGATTAAEAATIGWYDLGNIVSVQPQLDFQTLDHFGGYRGCIKRDKKISTSSSMDYILTVDEWSVGNLALGLGAADATDYTASAHSSTTEVYDFTSLTWGRNIWWDILDSSGNKIYNLTNVASVTHSSGATTLDEETGDGTGDYEVDLVLGRIRFLTSRTEADVTVTFNAAAVTSASTYFFNGITPLESGIRSGLGRLVIYDCDNPNIVTLDHLNFGCQIIPTELSEINGTNAQFGTIGLTVAVDASKPGVLRVRGSNN